MNRPGNWTIHFREALISLINIKKGFSFTRHNHLQHDVIVINILICHRAVVFSIIYMAL